MTISGTWTLITGGSSGIGEACAHVFAKEGSNIILLARDVERSNIVAEEVRAAYGVDVQTIICDVRNVRDTADQLHQTLETTPVDTAIINHGIGQYGRVAHSPWDDIEPVLMTNIVGAIGVAHAIVPSMLKRGSGSLIFLSTILDKRPIPNHAAYSASKSALRTFANVLRMELRGSGIHVGIVSPSRTITPFSKNVLYSEPPSPSVVSITSPALRAANDILTCVQKRRREITVSLSGKAYVFAGYHFPRITDWVLSRIVPKPGRTSR